MEGKTGRYEAIKPNLRKKQNWKEKMGWDYSNRAMPFKNSTTVFAMNILCCEYIISDAWSWMCLGPRTAGLGSRGWRSLFKYLYREENKA